MDTLDFLVVFKDGTEKIVTPTIETDGVTVTYRTEQLQNISRVYLRKIKQIYDMPVDAAIVYTEKA